MIVFYKRCQNCGIEWQNRNLFLADPDVYPLGFQPHFNDDVKGIVIFHHQVSNCLTTMAIPLAEFFDLIPGFDSSKNFFQQKGCHQVLSYKKLY